MILYINIKRMLCCKYANELYHRYHYKFVLMTHVSLVPDKCTPDFWLKYAIKKFFARFFLRKLLKISNNWYIIYFLLEIFNSFGENLARKFFNSAFDLTT